MKKIVFLLWFIGVILTNGLTVVAQQQKPETVSETEFEILKEHYQQLLEKDEKVIARYGDIITELKEERKAHQDFVEKVYTYASAFISIVAVLFGGLLAFWGWNRFKQVKEDVDSIVTKKCTDMITDVVTGKRDIIEKQLSKYDLQAKLRRDNKIIILSESIEKGDPIEKYLKKVDFEVDKAVISTYYNTDGSYKSELNNWDVVIFNNLTTDIWTNKEVQEKLINTNSSKSILFYLGGKIGDNNKKFHVSAVNMPSQLYGNLMNLLEYQNALKS